MSLNLAYSLDRLLCLEIAKCTCYVLYSFFEVSLMHSALDVWSLTDQTYFKSRRYGQI